MEKAGNNIDLGTVSIIRPVRLANGEFDTLQFERAAITMNNKTHLTVVKGQHPLEFMPPPAIPLDATDPLRILELLEYAGVHYLDPDCPAAKLGIDIFDAGRRFALESAPDWIGVDWDYTTNLYKIYGPVTSLISMKLFHIPPSRVQKQSIRLFEAAKPGMHELIMGLAVGYALRQGLRSFDQWKYYRPQVRSVTQTWPDRLARLGTGAIRLVALMMGRYPGRPLTEDDIRASDAFITVDDFLRQIANLLNTFENADFQFHALAEREQDEVMELLRAGKAYKLKPLSTFSAKGWMPPPLIFDDSPSSNARLINEGVRVVSVVNPVVPGKEMSDLHALSLRGRKAAARQMVAMASHTEGPAMIDALTKLKHGASEVQLSPDHLVPTPEGSIMILHDISGSVADLMIKFKEPQYRINTLIKSIIRKAGGMRKLAHSYAKTASLRNHVRRSWPQPS